MTNPQTLKPTEAHARKVLEVVDCGLVKGVGEPVPGQMCIEAAVNYAFGLPHGDQPPCVGEYVRDFKIRLNDVLWSSDQARAQGMRRLAIAQLGSNEIDQETRPVTAGLRVETYPLNGRKVTHFVLKVEFDTSPSFPLPGRSGAGGLFRRK